MRCTEDADFFHVVTADLPDGVTSYLCDGGTLACEAPRKRCRRGRWCVMHGAEEDARLHGAVTCPPYWRGRPDGADGGAPMSLLPVALAAMSVLYLLAGTLCQHAAQSCRVGVGIATPAPPCTVSAVALGLCSPSDGSVQFAFVDILVLCPRRRPLLGRRVSW